MDSNKCEKFAVVRDKIISLKPQTLTKVLPLDSPEPEPVRARTDSFVEPLEPQLPNAAKVNISGASAASAVSAPEDSNYARDLLMEGRVRRVISHTGHGIGRGGPSKRHRKLPKDVITGCMTRPSIRRLARRGGVKRISSDVYAAVRAAVKTRISETIRRAAAIVEARRQTTVTPNDIVYALRQMGTSLYGFGEGRIYNGYSYA